MENGDWEGRAKLRSSLFVFRVPFGSTNRRRRESFTESFPAHTLRSSFLLLAIFSFAPSLLTLKLSFQVRRPHPPLRSRIVFPLCLGCYYHLSVFATRFVSSYCYRFFFHPFSPTAIFSLRRLYRSLIARFTGIASIFPLPISYTLQIL